jgi:hypothetical protein
MFVVVIGCSSIVVGQKSTDLQLDSKTNGYSLKSISNYNSISQFEALIPIIYSDKAVLKDAIDLMEYQATSISLTKPELILLEQNKNKKLKLVLFHEEVKLKLDQLKLERDERN